MKKLFLFLFVASCLGQSAQTHVWGGLYSNTTWLKTNSPYIVDSLLVIFPGVKLEIQAGVTVKFAPDVVMEVRQGTLSLVGTANDSIHFTSSATQPQRGAWAGIFLHGGVLGPVTQYFSMSFSDRSFFRETNAPYYPGTNLYHSTFRHNNFGAGGFDNVTSCLFENNGSAVVLPKYTENCTFNNNDAGIINAKGLTTNCTFRNNQSGIMGLEGTAKKCLFLNNLLGISSISKGVTYPHIDSCIFKKNDVAMARATFATITNNTIDSNNVGILANGSDHIEKNSIRYNQTGIYQYVDQNTGWYYGASTITENTISFNDIGLEVLGHDDVISCNTICSNSTYNLKYLGTNNTVIPYARKNNWCMSDSSLIAASIYDGFDNVTIGLVNFMPLGVSACYSTVDIKQNGRDENISLYPNPTSGNLKINYRGSVEGTLQIFDIKGQVIYSAQLKPDSEHGFRLNAAPGIYICELKTNNFTSFQKIVLTE